MTGAVKFCMESLQEMDTRDGSDTARAVKRHELAKRASDAGWRFQEKLAQPFRLWQDAPTRTVAKMMLVGCSVFDVEPFAPELVAVNTRQATRHCFQPERRAFVSEIPSSQVRRRAAMARAVLPNPSARAEWLFSGIIDRAQHHWGHVPALDGGPGDHDLDDSENDTAILHGDDDIVSQASYAYESVQVSNYLVCPHARGGVLGGRGSPTQGAGPAASQVSAPLGQSPPREQF